MTEYRAQVDELLAEYRRSREHLAEVHQRLSEISAAASSADGAVTATVGPRGTLTGLTISEDAYQRHKPAELADLIVRVTATAAASALSDASSALAPALPTGTDPAALLLGTGDLTPSELRPEPAAAAPTPDVDAQDEEPEEVSVFEDFGRGR